jgi:5-hydroxyisourate hydrolase
MAATMTRISTHILDISLGKPAGKVPVRLERQSVDGHWAALTSACTDQDGRCGQLWADELSDGLPAGIYRLVLDTQSYYDRHNIIALYPFVEITFQVREGESHFHIPLLLSANGYTTYRGS